MSTRGNPGSARDVAPALADDGRAAFTLFPLNDSGGPGDRYRRALNGTGEPELLWQSSTQKHPNDWSPDGRFLIFDDHHATRRQDLWLLPMDGDRKPQPLLVTDADEALAQFSPDGRWIQYRSDESGRSEVYISDFVPGRSPALGNQKWTISREGGDKPTASLRGLLRCLRARRCRGPSLRQALPLPAHVTRRATIGSTFMARRAGK